MVRPGNGGNGALYHFCTHSIVQNSITGILFNPINPTKDSGKCSFSLCLEKENTIDELSNERSQPQPSLANN